MYRLLYKLNAAPLRGLTGALSNAVKFQGLVLAPGATSAASDDDTASHGVPGCCRNVTPPLGSTPCKAPPPLATTSAASTGSPTLSTSNRHGADGSGSDGRSSNHTEDGRRDGRWPAHMTSSSVAASGPAVRLSHTVLGAPYPSADASAGSCSCTSSDDTVSAAAGVAHMFTTEHLSWAALVCVEFIPALGQPIGSLYG